MANYISTSLKKMIDLSKVSACLITKDPVYPNKVLKHTASFSFGEILLLTNCDSPYRKYELFNKVKYDVLYYSDDDAICPIDDLVKHYQPGMLNISMDPPKIEQYKNSRMSMGMGWGSLFEKSLLQELKRYTNKYGEDELFKRDTEKILTELVYPQNRIVSLHQDLPSAMAPDRLWRQSEHWSNMHLIRQRCATLITYPPLTL